MIVRLRDGTEFYATRTQADKLWNYKIKGIPWAFGDYRGDPSAILTIRPGGQPPREEPRPVNRPLLKGDQCTEEQRYKDARKEAKSVREILIKKGILKKQ